MVRSYALVAVMALFLTGCSGFQNPFGGDLDQQVLYAGDAGDAICTGVTIIATEKEDPTWITNARVANATARETLLSAPLNVSALMTQLNLITPVRYKAALGSFERRLTARATGGIIEPDSGAYQLVQAFLDACDLALPFNELTEVAGSCRVDARA